MVEKGVENPRSIFSQTCSFARRYIHNVLVSFVLYLIPPSVPNTSKYQVFMCPGASRFISNNIGTSSPSIETNVLNVALFQVSLSAHPPFPSGRRVIIFCKVANTLLGSQPSLSGTCKTC